MRIIAIAEIVVGLSVGAIGQGVNFGQAILAQLSKYKALQVKMRFTVWAEFKEAVMGFVFSGKCIAKLDANDVGFWVIKENRSAISGESRYGKAGRFGHKAREQARNQRREQIWQGRGFWSQGRQLWAAFLKMARQQ